MRKEQVRKHPSIRVSSETYEMLSYLKRARRRSYDTVILDMLSEFAPLVFDQIMNEHDPQMEIEDFGTPKYAAWRETFLRAQAKLSYSEFKKREWRKIEDEEIGTHPRMAIFTRPPGEKSRMWVF
jgi:hypothetical protein